MRRMNPFFPLCSLILLLLTGCRQDNPNAAMEEANKSAYMKSVEAFQTGNVALFDEVLAENFVDHNPDPMIPGTGREHWKNQVVEYRKSFPDMAVSVEHMVAKDDMVWGHFRVTGTNTGAMYGMPPTGKKMDVTGFEVVRFQGGKGVERWGVFDAATMMTQMGMMPEPGATPAGEPPVQ